MKHIPKRTCIGCKNTYPQHEMIAICRMLSGKVNLFTNENLHDKKGRCAYLCKNVKCLLKAKNRKPMNGLRYTLKLTDDTKVWEELNNLFINK